MKTIRILSCICAIALGLALHASPAAAQPATVPCGTAIDGYFHSLDWINVIGARVTARGSLGFSSFTMASGYNLATTPLNTPTAGVQSTFSANRGTANFAGQFSEVFPGRGNSDVDRWDFWVSTTGTIYLRSITWGGTWATLQGVVCYRGPQDQTLVTGYYHTAGYSTDFWTFVLGRGGIIF